MGAGLAPSLGVWNTLLEAFAAQGAWADGVAALRQVHHISSIILVRTNLGRSLSGLTGSTSAWDSVVAAQFGCRPWPD